MRPYIALAATTACTVLSRLHPNVGGSPTHPAESSSLSCGPAVRFRLLPTPPHGDAVAFSYGVVAYTDRDFHPADKSPSWAHDETASRQIPHPAEIISSFTVEATIDNMRSPSEQIGLPFLFTMRSGKENALA